VAAAFPTEPVPSREALFNGHCCECAEVSEAFGYKPWSAISLDELRAGGETALLTPTAWRYYLPAVITWCVRAPEAVDVIQDNLVFQLAPPQKSVQEPPLQWFAERAVGFTVEQRQAIVAYLNWYREREETACGALGLEPPNHVYSALAHWEGSVPLKAVRGTGRQPDVAEGANAVDGAREMNQPVGSGRSHRGTNRQLYSRVLSSICLAFVGGAAVFKAGFLTFGPVDSGGGFVGEGMFYAGALQFVAASMLAAGLLFWCLALLVMQPLLPAWTIPDSLIAVVSSGVVASPFFFLFLRGRSLMHLGIFVLLWLVLLPCLWGCTIRLSGRKRDGSGQDAA